MVPISLIFVTHNRSEILYNALKAAQGQLVPLDIIVMDDASTDGTELMIKDNFPNVKYCRSTVNYGPAYQRNEGAKMAISDIIFFLDDDTIIIDKNTVKDTIDGFSEANIGAVTIPFINILQNKIVNAASPNKSDTYVYHSFIAAAFAVRKSVFLNIGGFRQEYFYMGEEGDFCLRLLEAGFYVKAGSATPAFHYQPANRISFSADFYGRRNDILFLYLNAPFWKIPLAIIYTVVLGLFYGIRVGRAKFAYMGIIAGFKLLLKEEIRIMRHPVSNSVFKKFRYLKKNEPLKL